MPGGKVKLPTPSLRPDFTKGQSLNYKTASRVVVVRATWRVRALDGDRANRALRDYAVMGLGSFSSWARPGVIFKLGLALNFAPGNEREENLGKAG